MLLGRTLTCKVEKKSHSDDAERRIVRAKQQEQSRVPHMRRSGRQAHVLSQKKGTLLGGRGGRDEVVWL
jgi:hypothetical protein